ncbi:unnamed protein product, partial [Timema podura]|nr:unnamed protein product [Timema podura]
VHGPSSGCPHPRVLPNLVSVCLASIFSNFEVRRDPARRNEAPSPAEEGDVDGDNESRWESREDRHLRCYITVFLHISEYDDWRPGLAQLLQPIPFPDEALGYQPFIHDFMPVIQRIGTDSRCEVHQMVLGIREGKEGWFDIYCPSSLACSDDVSVADGDSLTSVYLLGRLDSTKSYALLSSSGSSPQANSLSELTPTLAL